MLKRKRCEEDDDGEWKRRIEPVPVYYFEGGYLPREIWSMIRDFINYDWRKCVQKSKDGNSIRRHGGQTEAIETYAMSLVNKRLYEVVGKSYVVRQICNGTFYIIKFENMVDTEFGVSCKSWPFSKRISMVGMNFL
jgi:hypothetical protein